MSYNKTKRKLKAGEEIFIQDDFSKKNRIIQKLIRIKAKEERNNGKTTKIGQVYETMRRCRRMKIEQGREPEKINKDTTARNSYQVMKMETNKEKRKK